MTLEILLRCAFFLAVASVLVKTLLRITRCQSPTIHRLAWFIVLLVGIVWFHKPVRMPVLEPVAVNVQESIDVDTAEPEFSFEYAPPMILPQFDAVEEIAFQEIVVEREFEPAPIEIPIIAASNITEPDFHVEEIVLQEENDRDFLLTHIILAVWISGIFVLLIFKGFVYVRLLHKLRQAVSPSESDTAAFERLLNETKISPEKRIRILLTDQLGPALARIPGGHVILVPKTLWEEASEEIRRGILLHEISHFRHHDGVKSLFAWLLAVVQWFNPAAWFALKRFHDAAEWRCDAEAYGNQEESLALFAESLLMLHKTGDRYVGVLQTFRLQTFGKGELMERIEKLTEHQFQRKESFMKRLCLLTCIALLLAAGTLRIELVAKDAEAEPTPPQNSATETKVDDAPEEKRTLIEQEVQYRAEFFKARERYDQFVANMPSEKRAALSDEYKTLSDAVETARRKWEQANALRDIASEELIYKDMQRFIGKKVDYIRAETVLKSYQKTNAEHPSAIPKERLEEAEKKLADAANQLVKQKEILLQQHEITKKRFEAAKAQAAAIENLFENGKASTPQLEDAKRQLAYMEKWLRKTENNVKATLKISWDKPSKPDVDESKSVTVYGEAPKVANVLVGSDLEKVREAERRILQKLDEPFLFDFKGTMSFGRVMGKIQKETDIPIIVDYRALLEAGVGLETPTKLRLPGMMPLMDVLRYLEKQHGVAATVKDGVLLITTPKRATGRYYTVTYYVGDLLKGVTKEQRYDANGKPTVSLPVSVPEDAFAPVIDYIKTMVAPESWKTDLNDSGADILTYHANMSLVIKHREDVHQQIANLLKNLRKYNDVRIDFDVEIWKFNEKNEVLRNEKPYRTQLTLISGGPGGTCQPDTDGKYSVRITPHSGKPVPAMLAAKNEALEFILPKGCPWSIKAKAMKRDGHDIIVVTVLSEDKILANRTFYASPIVEEEQPYVEEKEVFMLGTTIPSQPKKKEVVQRVYDISGLSEHYPDTTPIIDLIQSVTGITMGIGTPILALESFRKEKR